MAGIQLGGLESGLDTASIIDQLMAAERAPRTHMALRQSTAQARETQLRAVSDRLKAVRDAAQDLGSVTTWNPVQSMSSSDDKSVSGRQLSGAGPGSYSVAVSQLATADQHTYTYTPPASADSIQIGGVSIPLDAGATIDQAAAAINGNAEAGVFAVAVDLTGSGTKSLVLSARATGTAKAFTAAGGALAEQAARAKPAKDAKYTVDGGPQQTSGSNVVPNGIPGVELTLRAVNPGTTVTVGDPTVDRGPLISKVKAFVDAYNSAMDFLRGAASDKPVANPTSTLEAGRGTLYGDPTLNVALDALRSTMRQAFPPSGSSGFTLLSQLGISTGAASGSATFSADSVAGKLTFDQTAFNKALDTDPLAVQRMLGADPSKGGGLARAMQDKLASFVQAGGILDGRMDSARTMQKSLTDQIARFDASASAKQAILQRQFTALETSLQKLHAQGSDLAARLGLNTSDN
jgi:flagellar hook-associated protein 2